jgi:GntR family transcriptional regulator
MTDWISSSAQYLVPHHHGAPDAWEQEAAEHGRIGAHRLVSVERRVPPARLAMLLGIDPQEEAIVRRRLVTLDELPVEVSDSWYPLRVAEGTELAEPGAIRGGAAKALADLGYEAARHVEEVAVADVPQELLTLLPETVALELTRVSYNAAELPFEVAHMVMSRELAPGMPRRLRYAL